MNRALVLLVAVTVAGCGGGGGGGEARPGDGRLYGHIRALDEDSLLIDPAEFLTGDAAQRAAENAGAVEIGEPVPNDYYVHDPDPATTEIALADEVRVTRVACPDSCRDGVAGDFEGLRRSFREDRAYTLADPYRGAQGRYWVTVEDGRVVAIDEQYLP